MIGTGPYKMKEYTPGSQVILERNEDYWQTNEEYRDQPQQANVKTINYKFINDSTTRIMMFKTGEADLSDSIETQYTYDFLDGAEFGDRFNVFSYPAGLIMNLWANCHEESICSDINMRKAIFYAISTDDIVLALGGADQPAYTYSNDTTADFISEWNEMENYNSYRGAAEERQALVKQYLDAAKAMNCSKLKIVFRHMVPNIISPSIVGTTMIIGHSITSAASLSFVGLGIQPPDAEWGAMLSGAKNYMLNYPHEVLFPGIAILITVLATNMIGDGLRDALDPRLKD